MTGRVCLFVCLCARSSVNILPTAAWQAYGGQAAGM